MDHQNNRQTKKKKNNEELLWFQNREMLCRQHTTFFRWCFVFVCLFVYAHQQAYVCFPVSVCAYVCETKWVYGVGSTKHQQEGGFN